MIVCYPSCRKCKQLLLNSIDSIEKNNKDVTYFIFNNKISYFKKNKTIKTDEYEYSIDDLKEIKQHCKRLVVVNIDKWMDIFDNYLPLHEQTNTYMRLLIPRFFQKYDTRIVKFIYSDEDVLSIGKINKFWNIPFNTDILGISDVSSNHICHVTIHSNESKYYKIPKTNYINAGLLLFKNKFNIMKSLNYLNSLSLDNLMDISICHDQTIINTYPKTIIKYPILDYSYLVYNVLKLFNIAHIYYKIDLKTLIDILQKEGYDVNKLNISL